jgi:hypothetical protein
MAAQSDVDSTTRSGQRTTFWVERLARSTGFAVLSARLFGERRHAPYLFVLTVVLLDVPVLSTFNYVRGLRNNTAAWWQWPGVAWWLLPVAVLLAVFLLRALAGRAHGAMRAAGKPGDDAAADARLSRRLQYGTLLLGLASYALWLSTLLGPTLQDEGPVVGSVKFLLFIPVVYLPIATDLAAMYVHVQLVLPLRIREADVPLDFSDPRRLGGFYPVGRAMWFAAVSVFVSLTLYTILWAFGFFVDAQSFPPSTRAVVVAFFALAWTLASVVLVVGLYLLHRHMATCRGERLDEIHETVRQSGGDDETLPYTEPRGDAEFREYMRRYVELDRVERTRTVPFNVVVAWELVAAALFPVVLQIVSMLL